MVKVSTEEFKIIMNQQEYGEQLKSDKKSFLLILLSLYILWLGFKSLNHPEDLVNEFGLHWKYSDLLVLSIKVSWISVVIGFIILIWSIRRLYVSYLAKKRIKEEIISNFLSSDIKNNFVRDEYSGHIKLNLPEVITEEELMSNINKRTDIPKHRKKYKKR